MSEDREMKSGKFADDDKKESTEDVEAHYKAGKSAAEDAPSDEGGDDDVEAHMKATKQ